MNAVDNEIATPPLDLPGKNERLVSLGDAPLVVETPESLLDDETTPTDKLFIRNNGAYPPTQGEVKNWTVVIDGEVENPLELTLADLQSRFETITQRMVMECGGNGRSFYSPLPSGNRWTNGGVGCARWTGARLADVLTAARPKSSALFTGHFGSDGPDRTDASKQAMSRGVPMKKALDPNNLIAWAVNGEPLPLLHGFPMRLVIPGWPGSISSKWLTRIWVRDRPHDGKGMGGISYRVPIRPMRPGEPADPDNFRDLESMPVRSIVTSPADGTRLPSGTRVIHLRGAAWAGDLTVSRVDLSLDRGATWQAAKLADPINPYDWQRWTAEMSLPSDGYFEVWARATDSAGVMQPHSPTNWNPGGYGGNPMHHIAVTVG